MARTRSVTACPARWSFSIAWASAPRPTSCRRLFREASSSGRRSRALANDPPIVVADEPTGNLDSHNAEAILELFGELAADGKTALMVTQERDVSRYADQVVTLVDGRISGTAARVPLEPTESTAAAWSAAGASRG